MANSYLDQLVTYPAEIINRIASDDTCVGLLVNKAPSTVDDTDRDAVLDEHLFDYQYVDSTTQTSTAYVWVEVDVGDVENKHIKDLRVYVTIACHKSYMKLETKVFKGMMGNRRDNLARRIDVLLNDSEFLGIGRLSLKSVNTCAPINGFTVKELTYITPDFNQVPLN